MDPSTSQKSGRGALAGTKALSACPHATANKNAKASSQRRPLALNVVDLVVRAPIQMLGQGPEASGGVQKLYLSCYVFVFSQCLRAGKQLFQKSLKTSYLGA